MLKKAALLLSFGVACFAAPTVATVTSPQPIALDGHALTGVIINSWPLVAGDKLATSDAPATVSFKDGSSVELGKDSTASLMGTAQEPKLILVGGSLDYKIAPGSKLIVAKASETPKALGAEGKATVKSSRSFPTGLVGVGVTSAATAGAAIAGMTVTSGSSNAVATGTISTPVSALSTSVSPVAHTSQPQIGCPTQAYLSGYIYGSDPALVSKYGLLYLTCYNPSNGKLWY